MNRRQLLVASSAAALAACGGAGEKSTETASPSPAPTPQTMEFKRKIQLPVANRPLTSLEIFYEAHVMGILVTAFHQPALDALEPGGAASSELSTADSDALSKVKAYMANNPNTVEPYVKGLRQIIKDITLYAAGSTSDSYDDNPLGCLSAGNLQIVQSLFQVKKPQSQ
jgi:hypothetical protein